MEHKRNARRKALKRRRLVHRKRVDPKVINAFIALGSAMLNTCECACCALAPPAKKIP